MTFSLYTLPNLLSVSALLKDVIATHVTVEMAQKRIHVANSKSLGVRLCLLLKVLLDLTICDSVSKFSSIEIFLPRNASYCSYFLIWQPVWMMICCAIESIHLLVMYALGL